ncbi:hypothetical protein LBMAG46_28730 [Planctomycetia bacterium]|nr:hypothetical protein LBMAG46_28730 [Planctomycetia bacterium]
MLLPLKSWLISVLVVMLVAAGYYRAFEKLPLPASDDQRLRNDLAERWAQKVSSEIRQLTGRPTIAVARVVGDDHGTLTAELKRWIARRNVIMLNDQWLSDIGYTFGTSSEPKTREQAVNGLIDQGIDFVVVAEVLEWTTYPEFDAQLVGIVQLLNGHNGQITHEFRLSMPEVIQVAGGPAADQIPGTTDAPATAVADSAQPSSATISSPAQITASLAKPAETLGLQMGFLAWLTSVALAPLFLRNIILRTMRRHSNLANLQLLLSWIAGCLILAAATWLPGQSPLTATLLAIPAVAAAAVYFAFVCRKIHSFAG